MTTTNIDYINLLFEYPVITPIQGQPTYSAMKVIKDEMKANLKSVPTDLGGGANEHLGLMLTSEEDANVTLILYVRSVHTGALIVPPGTTLHESTRLREDFKEQLRQYRECTQVEKAIIKQLRIALPKMYFKGFRKPYTGE